MVVGGNRRAQLSDFRADQVESVLAAGRSVRTPWRIAASTSAYATSFGCKRWSRSGMGHGGARCPSRSVQHLDAASAGSLSPVPWYMAPPRSIRATRSAD
jgi:hypothetical protein